MTAKKLKNSKNYKADFEAVNNYFIKAYGDSPADNKFHMIKHKPPDFRREAFYVVLIIFGKFAAGTLFYIAYFSMYILYFLLKYSVLKSVPSLIS